MEGREGPGASHFGAGAADQALWPEDIRKVHDISAGRSVLAGPCGIGREVLSSPKVNIKLRLGPALPFRSYEVHFGVIEKLLYHETHAHAATASFGPTFGDAPPPPPLLCPSMSRQWSSSAVRASNAPKNHRKPTLGPERSRPKLGDSRFEGLARSPAQPAPDLDWPLGAPWTGACDAAASDALEMPPMASGHHLREGDATSSAEKSVEQTVTPLDEHEAQPTKALPLRGNASLRNFHRTIPSRMDWEVTHGGVRGR
ncbi:hypothetical protein CPLU01_03853 [Colletotrichum plurivorum]|uniref:Uncharacterized protein n=1 Tax=Colletotrichum plurivorum TaxID=2175906 RepID=A0A8H6KR33_9PEZI|nr:hypothetical protein CPLU01_03853 [Colletotrichum plurivorum]